MSPTLNEIIYHSFETLNMFTPSIPYYFQVKKFYKTESSLGFSKKTSFLIILSGLLRIFFWFGKRFNTTLLVQSILLTIMQFYVIYASIKFQPENDDRKFWELEWKKMRYYNIFFIVFSFIMSLISFSVTFENYYYVELLGFLSSSLEVALLLPQIIDNYNYKTTENLSNILVACFILGDSIKAYYFVVSNAPSQFLLGAILQVVLDFVLVSQVFIYRHNKVKGI